MIVESVAPTYRVTSTDVRVTEWRTYRDEKTGKDYHYSRYYKIRLYNKNGIEEEYTNESEIDVKA